MMKSLLAATLMTGLSTTAMANEFCAPSATAAATSLAKVNGTVAEVLEVATKDGKTFKITLSDKELGEDTYMVRTSGGHECTVYAVVVYGEPTRVP